MLRSRAHATAAVVGLVLGASLLGGCTQKMLRATPFGGGIEEAASEEVEGRVNVWPLVYHRTPVTSILWPVGEITDEGWAIRPLYAQYSGVYDIAWPFLHLEPARGSGYLFPLAFWGKDRFLMPLLFGFGGSDEAGHVYSPLFYRSWRETSGGFQHLQVIPPLLTWWGSDGDDESDLFTPLVGHWRDGDETDTALLPLLTFWGSDGEDESYLFTPLFGHSRDGEETDSSLPLLLTFWGRESEADRYFFTPLYFHRRWDEDRQLDLFPLALSWRYQQERDERVSHHLLLSIVGGSHWDDGWERHFFPFYFQGEETLRGEKLLRAVGPRSGDFLESGRARNSHFFLMPFYGHVSSAPDSQAHFLPFLLSSWNHHGDRGGSWHLLLSSIAGAEMQDEEGQPAWSMSRILPFYSYNWRGGKGVRKSRSSLILPWLLYGTWWEDDSEYRHHNIAWFVGRWTFRQDSSSHHLLGIYNYSHEILAEPVPKNEPGAPQAPAGSETLDPLSEKTRLDIWPILFDREVVEYTSGRTYRRSRLVWKLYHGESVDDRTSVDIFPFITYDRDGDESLTWSWLHSFVRYERDGDSGSFRFLFVPVWWWGESGD